MALVLDLRQFAERILLDEPTRLDGRLDVAPLLPREELESCDLRTEVARSEMAVDLCRDARVVDHRFVEQVGVRLGRRRVSRRSTPSPSTNGKAAFRSP